MPDNTPALVDPKALEKLIEQFPSLGQKEGAARTTPAEMNITHLAAASGALVSALFVGGTHDTARISIPNDVRRVKLQAPGATPEAPHIETDYQRHAIVLMDRSRLVVFAPIGISQDNVMRMLVENYRKP